MDIFKQKVMGVARKDPSLSVKFYHFWLHLADALQINGKGLMQITRQFSRNNLSSLDLFHKPTKEKKGVVFLLDCDHFDLVISANI